MPFDREGTLRKAEKLLRQGKLDLAIAHYRAVIEDQPSDWNTANTLGDLYFRGGQIDKAIAQYNDIAAHLANEGVVPKAVALYRKILKIKPDEERAMWHLGNISARQGLLVEARSNFTQLAQRRGARGDSRGEAEVRIRLGDLDGADLDTRLAGARARAELGDPKSAVERLKQYAADLQQKGKDDDALRLLSEAAQLDPEDLPLRQLLVRTHIERGDLSAASQFAATADEKPCLAAELSREPSDRSNIGGLRRALILAGETDVDAIIAERFGSQSPLTSTDFMWPADPGGAEMAPMPVAPPSPPAHQPEPMPTAEPELPVDTTPSRLWQSSAPDVSESLPAAVSSPQPSEVDLTAVLLDLRMEAAPAPGAPLAIENVLQGLRDKGANDASPETAERHFKMAATYVDMGMQEEAMKALEAAARSPRHRFRAGAMLAKACLDAGDPVRAIEWYEMAVEAPTPSPMAHYALLYELASVLESNGEGARALAVLLELQSEAGEYRDVSAHLERLKVQIGS